MGSKDDNGAPERAAMHSEFHRPADVWFYMSEVSVQRRRRLPRTAICLKKCCSRDSSHHASTTVRAQRSTMRTRERVDFNGSIAFGDHRPLWVLTRTAQTGDRGGASRRIPLGGGRTRVHVTFRRAIAANSVITMATTRFRFMAIKYSTGRGSKGRRKLPGCAQHKNVIPPISLAMRGVDGFRGRVRLLTVPGRLS